MWWFDLPGTAFRVVWWLVEQGGEGKRGWRRKCCEALGVSRVALYRSEKLLVEVGVLKRVSGHSRVTLVKSSFKR